MPYPTQALVSAEPFTNCAQWIPWGLCPSGGNEAGGMKLPEFIFSPLGSASIEKRTRLKPLEARRREQTISPQKDLQVRVSEETQPGNFLENQAQRAWILKYRKRKDANVGRLEEVSVKDSNLLEFQLEIKVARAYMKSPIPSVGGLFLEMCMWGCRGRVHAFRHKCAHIFSLQERHPSSKRFQDPRFPYHSQIFHSFLQHHQSLHSSQHLVVSKSNSNQNRNSVFIHFPLPANASARHKILPMICWIVPFKFSGSLIHSFVFSFVLKVPHVYWPHRCTTQGHFRTSIFISLPVLFPGAAYCFQQSPWLPHIRW